MHRFRLILLASAVGILLLAATMGHARAGDSLQASPERLQALFIQRLVRYVSWPENAAPDETQPYVIAATDAESLRPYFDNPKLADEFRLVQWPTSVYHVLVLNNLPDREGAAILKRTRKVSALTVNEGSDFAAGAAVNIHRVGDRLRLTINPDALRDSGLTVSSKLMRIARIYRETAQ